MAEVICGLCLGLGDLRLVGYFFDLVLISQLPLDDAEESVGRLNEHWQGAFLQVQVQNVCLAGHLVLGDEVVAGVSLAAAVATPGSGRSSPLSLSRLLWSILVGLVNVDEELQEVLSDEVFNELVIVNQLLVIYFRPALQFHFTRVVLPLNLNFHEDEAHKF